MEAVQLWPSPYGSPSLDMSGVCDLGLGVDFVFALAFAFALAAGLGGFSPSVSVPGSEAA